MTDLVTIARSRTDVERTHWEGCEHDHRECLIQRMADEIERLRAENERLRAEIKKLRDEELEAAIHHERLCQEQAERQAEEVRSMYEQLGYDQLRREQDERRR